MRYHFACTETTGITSICSDLLLLGLVSWSSCICGRSALTAFYRGGLKKKMLKRNVFLPKMSCFWYVRFESIRKEGSVSFQPQVGEGIFQLLFESMRSVLVAGLMVVVMVFVCAPRALFAPAAPSTRAMGQASPAVLDPYVQVQPVSYRRPIAIRSRRAAGGPSC